MDNQFTAADIKELKDTLPIIRSLARLGRIEKFVEWSETLPILERQVADLQQRRATISEELSAERAESLRALEASLEQTREAAHAETTRLLAQREANLQHVAGKIKDLEALRQRLEETMAAERSRLQNKLDTLKQEIREVSEASAKTLEEHRAAINQERAALMQEKNRVQTEKGELDREITELKQQKARIAQEFKAILS